MLFRSMPEVVSVPLNGPIGPWWLLGVFNWEGAAQSRMIDLEALGLPRAGYWIADLWERDVRRLAPGQLLGFDRIAAHGGHLLAIRPVIAAPQWVASDLHFSQGCEVVAWEPQAHGLTLRLSLGRRAAGAVTLSLPRTTVHVVINDQAVSPQVLGPDLVRIPIVCEQEAEIRIDWSS